MKVPLVALVGNPNAGKTTLFNSLTGSHQKVGNYPGVTVERVSGTLKLPSGLVDVIDVPGLYSVKAVSEDERVALEVIRGETRDLPKPDLLVCVLDASNLERNLFFYSQLVDSGLPIVVALTMVDRIKGRNQEIDLPKLSSLLGADIVPIVGHKDKGITELKAAIDRALENPKPASLDIDSPEKVQQQVAVLRERFARAGIDFTVVEVLQALYEPDERIESFLRDFPELDEAFTAARQELHTGEPARMSIEAPGRYDWAHRVEEQVVKQVGPEQKRSLTDRLDVVLTHRVFGLAIFIFVMGGVFQSIYTLAQPLMGWIQGGFDTLGNAVKPMLGFSPTLQSMIADGLIGGVGSMMVFLPQILILFFFIAFLEGTGYLARAAFLMDRLLGWAGLNGRAFIPLLSSFACAIPGIMSARVMPDPRSRLATILVAPLMSCSARLPVYILLIGAFIEPRYGPIVAGACLYGMHMLGLVVAIPIVYFLNRRMFKGKRLPFLLELPPYQWPKWRDVWIAMYFRAKVFVTTAGTIIVLMSILIWALSFFPRSAEAEKAYRTEYAQRTSQPADSIAADNYVGEKQLENSYLGRFGQSIEPVFRPAGFDWRITTSILSAFPARETVVPSLGIIFNLGSIEAKGKHMDLEKALSDAKWPDGRPLMTPWTSIGLMVFFALCCQCMSTLATIKRETNSVKWPLFVFSYMTALAYIGAVLINQVGLWFAK